MSEYALRKSYGSYSAGTRVEVVSEIHTNTIEHGRNSVLCWLNKDQKDALEIDRSNLIKLRPRATVAPLKNRRARRTEKHKAQAILQSLINHDSVRIP